jgi:hypothetical protein
MTKHLFEFEFTLLRGRVKNKLVFLIEDRYGETCFSIDVLRFFPTRNKWDDGQGISIPIRFLPTLVKLITKCEKVVPLI